jgi:HTH-type transcriptional regulator/antitoxin HigA
MSTKFCQSSRGFSGKFANAVMVSYQAATSIEDLNWTGPQCYRKRGRNQQGNSDMLKPILVQLRGLGRAALLTHIDNQHDYESALALIDELVDDYDNNVQLLDLLAASIERWEDNAEEFAEFNRRVAAIPASSST